MDNTQTNEASKMNELYNFILTLATNDFEAAQELFNNNLFSFTDTEYNTLMDLLDK